VFDFTDSALPEELLEDFFSEREDALLLERPKTPPLPPL
jgi:hypothetical protein